MNIRQLIIFKTVCDEESITKAAEVLYISQPAVSVAIKELEEYLDVVLFDRLSGIIYLNETGSVFLSKVNNFLNLYNDLDANIKNIDLESPLKIGSSITIANNSITSIIKQFNDIYPKTPVNLTVKNARSIEKMVNNNELDLGLIEGVVSNSSLERVELSSYDLSLLCSPKHKFANKTLDSLDDISKETFLLREQGSAIRDLFDSTLRINNITIDPLWTSTNSSVLVKGVEGDIGITILPKSIVEKELNENDLCEIRIRGVEFSNKNYLTYNRGKLFEDKLLELKKIILKCL